MIMHLKDSQRADAVRRVDISRMPGQGRVQAVKDALSCHECLSGAALLSRTAVVDHGPFLPVFLQIILDRHSGGKGTSAKQVMAAAVALFARGLRLRRIRFLGHGVKGVVFSQNIFAKGAGTRKGAACRILPPYPPLRNGVCDEDCRIYAENLSGGL